MSVEELCGAPAVGGLCVLQKGHNMGRLDIPMNHRSSTPADAQINTGDCTMQQCNYCDEFYPWPIDLHHTQEECQNNLAAARAQNYQHADAQPTPLVDRINIYLATGGLWNPELANHDAVRDLLIDCRNALAANGGKS